MRDFDRIMLTSEVQDLREEVGRLFEDLDRTAAGRPQPPGHCTPALDVVEGEAKVEVVVDLPGVPADRVRVLLKNGQVLIVGEKCSPYVGEQRNASFQLVERGFGRFARAVQLTGAFDATATVAIVDGGELRVTVPRIAERRGQEFSVTVATR
jgi:HSP20 family molecular chaperone IbpA